MKKMHGNMNEVLTDHTFVYRKKNAYSETVSKFLIHLQEYNFQYTPKFVGENVDTYILEYIEGDEINLSLIDTIECHQALLKGLASIVNEFHTIGSTFEWQPHNYFLSYPGDLPIETMCHNDLAPYNMIGEGLRVNALIDFDTLCPGPRIWDIVYLAYRFIGLGQERLTYQKRMTETELKTLRMNLTMFLCQETNTVYNHVFFQTLIQRLESLCALFDAEISNGNQVFITMKKTGHYDFYQAEIQYIQEHYL